MDASVATKEGILSLDTAIPLIAPTTAPMAKPARIAAGMAKAVSATALFTIIYALIVETREMTDVVEKSMPPFRVTTVRPQATTRRGEQLAR